MRIQFSLLSGLFIASLALANDGVEGGNGGDAVVCRDEKGDIISSHLLDLYEGAEMGLEPQVPYSGEGEEAYLRRILSERLKDKVKPADYMRIQETIKTLVDAAAAFERNEFKTIKVFFTTATLVDRPDSNHITFPTRCAPEQLAERYEDERAVFYGGFEFRIQRSLWKSLATLDRAALILHEAILKIAKQDFKVMDSQSTRALVRELTTKVYSEEQLIAALGRVFKYMVRIQVRIDYDKPGSGPPPPQTVTLRGINVACTLTHHQSHFWFYTCDTAIFCGGGEVSFNLNPVSTSPSVMVKALEPFNKFLPIVGGYLKGVIKCPL